MVTGQKYHILYKTICTVTGNFYIGVHSTTNLEDGYLGSGLRLTRSLQKHGKEKHIREILEFLDSRDDLVKRESEIVNEEVLSDSRCMNLKKGGQGGLVDEEHGVKWQKAGTLAATEYWNNHSEKKAVQSRKNLNRSREEGKLRTRGQENFKGKRASHETLSRVHSGEKNSQFGSCWITKENETKKISQNDLKFHLENGWERGRKKPRAL
jgi:hypothetical protein